MKTYIQIHTLTNYAPANLNRDDLGRPKTAIVGGTERLRISSQCLKRTWRTSDVFEESLADNKGIRTKRLGVKIFDKLVEGGVAEKKAKEVAKAIISEFGKPKKADKDKPTLELEIEQLVHISPAELKAIDAIVANMIENSVEPSKDDLAVLRKKTNAVDIALFGRMLAASPKFNVEAAAQVAHAISVNKVIIEDDYFTAVDDLNDNEIDAGSGHLGETGFGSGVFYSYCCIDKTALIENLDGDETLANQAIQALVEAIATVAPSGKQNSYASRAFAHYMLIEKGNEQPRQLSAAFLKPVQAADGDFIENAVAALRDLKTNMDKAYGLKTDSAEMFITETGTQTLADLKAFVEA